MSAQAPIILAAGGTGGHIFPAEALAEELLSRGRRPILITDARSASFIKGTLANIEVHVIRTGRISGNPLQKLSGALKLLASLGEARKLLKELKPSAVIGFGGYPSFPTVLMASSLRIPSFIHEQNAVLGRANRKLARHVTVIATGFAGTRLIEPGHQRKTIFTGNPVRSPIRAIRNVPYPTADGPMTLLVTGGSQGASVFAKVVPAAIALLPEELRARIRISQQCREADLQAVSAAYEQMNVEATLQRFFTDMPDRLSGAHLVIARAGASTLAELAMAGRPAILVPYPHATDNHQADNALAFENAGAGWVLPEAQFTPQALASQLEYFIKTPGTLAIAAENAHRCGDINAAFALAELVTGPIAQ